MDHVRQRRNAPARLREALATTRGGLSVRELAAVTHLHENAVRRTLAALVEQGEVRSEQQRSGARGRPLLRYRLVGAADEPFKAVLPMLLDLLDAPEFPAGAAYASGFAHGSAAAGAGSTREAIVSSLVNLGFAPVERPGGGAGAGIALDLTSCPFRDAVTGSRNGRQICHLHHGLVAGIAAATGGALEEFVINDPLVQPCGVRFRELAEAAESTT
jgi:predicted ArsR family transcriptional regulator